MPDTPPSCSRREALDRAAALLRDAGIERPRMEARMLLAHALGLSTQRLLASLDAPADWEACLTLLRRRTAREPVALITGHREFWSLDFEVSPETLIPRADSETVVEAALVAMKRPDARVLDLGTGTGCLLLATLSERPHATGVGIDVAPGAVRLAARNAHSLGLGDRAMFLCADWAAPLNARFDVVICNPPYIAQGDLTELMPDVARFEPMRALDGGADGYGAYRRIVPDLGRLLWPGGVAVLEVGAGQADQVMSLAFECGFTGSVLPDLGGIARAVILRRDDSKKPFGSAAWDV